MDRTSFKRGILVAIEGIDGSGKTSLAAALHTLFYHNNVSVMLTKEPGGSVLGGYLRNILQENAGSYSPKAECLLFAADRAQHFYEKVLPALSQNALVISDRSLYSSIAYQGYGRGLDSAMINAINAWAMEARQPDLICYITIDPAVAYQRIKQRGQPLSSFEQEPLSFAKKLAEGFDAIFTNKDNVIVLDGNQSPETLVQSAYTHIQAWIHKNQLL